MYTLGQEVYYHADSAPFNVVGIRENTLEIEGDFSGGTHSVCQKSWVDINKVKPYDNSKVIYYVKGKRYRNGVPL